MNPFAGRGWVPVAAHQWLRFHHQVGALAVDVPVYERLPAGGGTGIVHPQ